MDSSPAENNDHFDPMSFYKQQQAEMLFQATQHVKASAAEIQEAQAAVDDSDSNRVEDNDHDDTEDNESTGHNEVNVEADPPSRRSGRSRAAAAHAKQALSMMGNEDDQDFERQKPPTRASYGRTNSHTAANRIGHKGGSKRHAASHHHQNSDDYTSPSVIKKRTRNGGGGCGGPSSVTAALVYKTLAEPQVEDETSLFFIIRRGRGSLQTVVDDWIDSYKVDHDSALLTLMQFFISASGCKGRITREMQEMEHSVIIKQMTEEFDEESAEYPLVATGTVWRKFKTSFCEFIRLLVHQCQYSIIYDQHLTDNIIQLLTQLSDSQVRAFRHTSTLAAMKLMTALVDVALSVSVSLQSTQRQYNSEQQSSRRSSDRLESLMTRRRELEENTEEIRNMLTYMFKAVFVHRYRDILPEIRSICMYEIGQWMVKYHTYFLDDTYLKYIGWTIHDKVGDVRLKCLQALQPLYASPELKSKLELFTSKFKDRIVEMTFDTETEVAVQAVKLVISILRYHRDMLRDKDCEQVYELVFCTHRGVAQAAGDFLNERLFLDDNDESHEDQDESDENFRSRRGKKRSPNTPHMRDLTQFFIESELHEHAAYLVDALIDSNPMIRDWECMTDLLLEEAGPKEDPLNDKQESALIEIMVCCVKQTATGIPPVGRGQQKKIGGNSKEMKSINEDRTNMTSHFIQALPALLTKYLPDDDKVANLLSIAQYFDLDVYTRGREERNLDSLLQLIIDIVNNHDSKGVLEAAAITINKLCSPKFTIYAKCEIALSRLLDKIVNVYNEASEEYRDLIRSKEEPNQDEIFKLVSSLKKVEVFSSHHNLNQLNIWDGMFDCLSKYIESVRGGSGSDSYYSSSTGISSGGASGFEDCSNMPSEAIRSALCTCHYGLIWDLLTIEASCKVSDNKHCSDDFASSAVTLPGSSTLISDPSTLRDQVDRLRGRLYRYMHMVHQMLKFDPASLTIIEDEEEGGMNDETRSSNAINQSYMAKMKGIEKHFRKLRDEAYISIVDLLVYFRPSISPSVIAKPSVSEEKRLLASLSYTCDPTLYNLLNDYVQECVFVVDSTEESSDGHESGGDGEEIDDHEKIEKLHSRRNLLSGMSKLIVNSIIPMHTAAHIFKHYMTFYNDFGDVIKTTMAKCREMNKVNCAKAMAQGLISNFEKLPKSADLQLIDRHSPQFLALKELAKRFALSFGLDVLKNRLAVTQLHRDLILNALNPSGSPIDGTPPPNIGLLEVASEFSHKVLRQDKKVVLNHIDKKIDLNLVPNASSEQWQPLTVYRNSLMSGGEVVDS